MERAYLLRFIFMAFTLLNVGSSSAQTSTFIKYIHTGFDNLIYSAIQTSDGAYIFSSLSIDDGSTLLIKINDSGEAFMNYKFTDPYTRIYQLLPDTDSTFIALGTVSDEYFQSNYFLFFRLDNEFNILDKKKYSIPYRIVHINYCKDHFNNIICNILLWGSISYNNSVDIALLRLNTDGDSLSFKHIQAETDQFSYCIMEKLDYSGYYLPEHGRVNPICSPYLNNMIEMDYNFNITFEDSVTNDVGLHSKIYKFNENQFLLSGNHIYYTYPPPPYDNEFIVVQKMDALYNAYDYTTIGPLLVDTVTYPAWNRNLDFRDTNNIFVGGTVNFAFYHYPEWKSYLILANLNSDLEKRWQFFFGFDHYYEASGLLATNDGGCLFYGTVCDYTGTSTDQCDLILIKTDSTGLVTGTSAYPDFKVSNAILFPNPGTDFLNIQSGPQISGAQFTLYDMQGRPVLQQNINTTQLRLQTSNLPAGTYPWQIVFKNKVIESGKWVKAGGE
jgi:hypothetical protein